MREKFATCSRMLSRLRHDVDVVEAEVGQPEPREELESFVELQIGRGLIQRPAVPGPVESTRAENIDPSQLKLCQ